MEDFGYQPSPEKMIERPNNWVQATLDCAFCLSLSHWASAPDPTRSAFASSCAYETDRFQVEARACRRSQRRSGMEELFCQRVPGSADVGSIWQYSGSSHSHWHRLLDRGSLSWYSCGDCSFVLLDHYFPYPWMSAMQRLCKYA